MRAQILLRKEDSVGLDNQNDEPPPDSFGDTEANAGSSPATAILSRRPRVMRMNPAARAFRRRHYPEVTDAEWADWRWQLRRRIRLRTALDGLLKLSSAEATFLDIGGNTLPFAVTPHYMALVNPFDPDQPLRRTVIPTVYECVRGRGESEDPLYEQRQSPVPGLVHRYPDRALLLVTDVCSTYCRYCTRSRVVGRGAPVSGTERLEAAFEYIRGTPAIRDVLISGGDPLMLDDEHLAWILGRLRSIAHVEILRIGTKTPATLPQRITSALVRVLRRAHPLWMSLHFTHPDECVFETARACAMLADAGIPLGSQTVLLKGVNDRVDTMRDLMHGLMRMRVRPYYLYQCDPIPGSGHFRAPVENGLAILRGLRGHTSGYAVPTYVIDAPGGGGKIPLMPASVVGIDGSDLVLKNYEGRTFRYPETMPSCESV